MEEREAKITAGLVVGEWPVTPFDVSRIIDGLANTQPRFRSNDLVPYVRSVDGPVDYQSAQEVLNRLFQRWRKMGLMSFSHGRWTLARSEWDEMQLAVSRLHKQFGRI